MQGVAEINASRNLISPSLATPSLMCSQSSREVNIRVKWTIYNLLSEPILTITHLKAPSHRNYLASLCTQKIFQKQEVAAINRNEFRAGAETIRALARARGRINSGASSSSCTNPDSHEVAMVPAELQGSLRQRRQHALKVNETTNFENVDDSSVRKHEEVVWGKTPGGEGSVFQCSSIAHDRAYIPFYSLSSLPRAHDP